MRAAIYCRVSTSGQPENGASLESQREAYLNLASERGYEVPSDYIFLEDWSGADLDLPKLERTRELVRGLWLRPLSAIQWTASLVIPST